MYQSVVVLTVVLVSLCSIVSCTDYCKICADHIACSSIIREECPSDGRMVVMTSTLKEAIINSHNTKRNRLASGSLPGFKPAVRMASMQWNDELANIASSNVRLCVYGHDSCRNTEQFRNSGQNTAKNVNYLPSLLPLTDSIAIAGQIDSWWAEYNGATMADMDKYSASQTIENFAEMAIDRNFAVGCAAINYKEDDYFSKYLVCNYATSNNIGIPIYKSGESGSNCTSGRNPLFPALCSASESIDPNKA